MPISPHLRALREAIGSQLVLIPAVSAIIHNEAGEVLLHLRADDGRWSLPAGGIDPGESPPEAIVREVREETGLAVMPVRVRGVFGGTGFRHVYPNRDEVEFTVIVFECRVTGGRLQPADGEALELRYFDPGSMPQLALPYPPELFRNEVPTDTLF